MAWLAVNKNGEEGIFNNKPKRMGYNSTKIYSSYEESFWSDEQWIEGECYDSEIPLPKGSIKKLIGRDLTWEDNPVELKEEQL